MTENAWKALVNASLSKPPTTVKAVTFLTKWESFSKPVALRCDDKVEYVVKGRQAGQAMERAISNFRLWDASVDFLARQFPI